MSEMWKSKHGQSMRHFHKQHPLQITEHGFHWLLIAQQLQFSFVEQILLNKSPGFIMSNMLITTELIDLHVWYDPSNSKLCWCESFQTQCQSMRRLRCGDNQLVSTQELCLNVVSACSSSAGSSNTLFSLLGASSLLSWSHMMTYICVTDLNMFNSIEYTYCKWRTHIMRMWVYFKRSYFS